MTYLVDTHWLVSFLNGRAQAVELLRKLSEEGIGATALAYDLILVSRDGHFDRIPELKRYRGDQP